MATVASQVVFHPTVSQSLKLGSTTIGRDKAYRAIQYFARFYAWYLLAKGDKDAAARWTSLKSHLGIARKLLRLGKPVEHLQAALRATLSSGPAGEQVTAIARQISYFGYLSLDALVWANAVKFLNLKSETAQAISKASNRMWLVGILLGIVNGSLKYARLLKESRSIESAQSSNLGEKAEWETKARGLKVSQAEVRQQLLMDSLDMWIPASALGLSQLNDGLVGIFGLTTSAIALQKQWSGVGGGK